MRKIFLPIFFFLMTFGAEGQNPPVKLLVEQSYEVPGTSIRAIEAAEGSVIWFAGSGGKYGRIEAGLMQLDSIEHEGKKPGFRSLAVNGRDVFVLSIENPALLYRLPETPGSAAPVLVYREDHDSVFYDSMIFINSREGIAMGDPTGPCLSILLTRDGGKSWTKIPCDQLPEVAEGEAGFAASDTNIAVQGDTIWIATGGKKARVWRSPDKGLSWEVFETPMVQGLGMTGIFSMDFADADNGIIMGGNWEEKEENLKTKAVTRDGGKTWHLMGQGEIPGYISCVQYVPGTGGREIMAVSTQGIFHSPDQGRTWAQISEEGFYSLRFDESGGLWMSRNNEIVRASLLRR